MKRYSIAVGSCSYGGKRLGYFMQERHDGQWVSYLESHKIIEKLENRILQLEAECKVLQETLGK